MKIVSVRFVVEEMRNGQWDVAKLDEKECRFDLYRDAAKAARESATWSNRPHRVIQEVRYEVDEGTYDE